MKLNNALVQDAENSVVVYKSNDAPYSLRRNCMRHCVAYTGADGLLI